MAQWHKYVSPVTPDIPSPYWTWLSDTDTSVQWHQTFLRHIECEHGSVAQIRQSSDTRHSFPILNVNMAQWHRYVSPVTPDIPSPYWMYTWLSGTDKSVQWHQTFLRHIECEHGSVAQIRQSSDTRTGNWCTEWGISWTYKGVVCFQNIITFEGVQEINSIPCSDIYKHRCVQASYILLSSSVASRNCAMLKTKCFDSTCIASSRFSIQSNIQSLFGMNKGWRCSENCVLRKISGYIREWLELCTICTTH
jgi:hypothetical protein